MNSFLLFLTAMRKIYIDKRTGKMIDRPQHRKRRRWMIVLACLLTAIVTTMPDLHLENILGIEYTWWFDMMQHGGYYFLFTVFLLFMIPREKRSFTFFLCIFITSVIFEFTQVFMPGRTFSFLDILSNFLGITTGFFVHNYKRLARQW